MTSDDSPGDLTALADRYGSDKGSAVLCAHRYAEVYEALLRKARHSSLRLLEIGLMHGHTQHVFEGRLEDVGCPSLRMWADYLPNAAIMGFDLEDFTRLGGTRMSIHVGDQGKRADLERLARETGGNFDVIVDDGSHASHHQQVSLGVLFQHLAPGGIYCIEDLHYQPAELEISGITKTRDFLRGLRFGHSGARVTIEQAELAQLVGQMRAIHFFDSRSRRWPLAALEDALAVIVKRGSNPRLQLDMELGART